MTQSFFQKILLAAFVFFIFEPTFLFADESDIASNTTSSTIMTQVISEGVLTLSSDTSVAFPSKLISSARQSAGALVNIAVSDTRGSGVGWSMSLSQTHLTTTKIVADPSNTGTMTVSENASSRFDGSMRYEEGKAHCTYVITAREDEQFDVVLQGEDNCTDTSFSSVTYDSERGKMVGATGISIDVSGTATVGDIWYLKTDTLPYTDMQIICHDSTAASGTTEGVYEGTCGALSGTSTTSDTISVLVAPAGYGMGILNQEIELLLAIHGDALSGVYRGSLFFSII